MCFSMLYPSLVTKAVHIHTVYTGEIWTDYYITAKMSMHAVPAGLWMTAYVGRVSVDCVCVACACLSLLRGVWLNIF